MELRLARSDRGAAIAFLRELIRIPSLSTEEGELAARLKEELLRVGVSDIRIDRIGNVVARIGPENGRRLLYNGHMDTVGVGNRATWSRDPFGAEMTEGIIHGRGAADMKGALAAMVYAAKILIDSGTQLGGDLYIVGVVQEEPCEGLAMRVLVEEEGIRPDWVVLGEATDLQLARGHRGRIELRVTTQGKSCHAATPRLGENAIYAAARIIVGIEMLAPQLSHDSFLGRGSTAVTDITSTASSRNAIPDSCTLCIDRRLTGGETETKALTEVRRIIAREDVSAHVEVSKYQATSYTGYECRARQAFPYWATPETTPLVRQAAQTIEKVLGFAPAIGRWEFSTDGAYTAGIAGIPTIGFGPGEERYVHTVDEQIRADDVIAAAEVYAQLAVDLLGTE
ncbi:MAG: YgeY family selenium metabolism-linked hydrolase [Chloroflexota bacterium]|nr:YgeY family selenium metabolism-linked hydrolase [Anaerolineae bacterium]